MEALDKARLTALCSVSLYLQKSPPHIANIRDNGIPRRSHPSFQTASALSGLLPCADLVLIQRIQLSHGNRRQIRHDYIGTGTQSHFPPLRVDRPQRRSCRNQGIGKQQPQNADQPQCLCKTAVGLFPKGRVLMGEIRSDADHVRLQFLQKS